MLKRKSSYQVHEYEYEYNTQDREGVAIIVAYVEKDKARENWLNLWLKTDELSGLMDFVVGYKIESDSENVIKKEIEKLIEVDYFTPHIKGALKQEEILEESTI